MTSELLGYGTLAVASIGALVAISVFLSPEQVAQQVETLPAETSVAAVAHALAPVEEAEDAEVCTFTSVVENGVFEGTVYTAGDHVRAEYRAWQQSGALTSFMLTDGVVVYAWGETPMGLVGTTYRVDVLTEQLETEGDDAQYAQAASDFGLLEGREYECEPWSVDESMFTVPDEVSFMDMTDMMKGWIDEGQVARDPSAAPTQGSETIDCSLCDSLPAELGEREQCRVSLGCDE